MSRQNADKFLFTVCGVSFYRGWGILVSFLVFKSLLISAYKYSKYLEYIQFFFEVHIEVFKSKVFGS